MVEPTKSNPLGQPLFERIGNARARVVESTECLNKLADRIFGSEPEQGRAEGGGYSTEVRQTTFNDEARWLEEAAERLNQVANRLNGIMS